MFDCIDEIDQDESCEGLETKRRIELGIEEYVEEMEAEFHDEQTTYNVRLEYSENLSHGSLIAYVKTKDADFTQEFYESVLSLVEELNNKIHEEEFSHTFTITVDLKNETVFGHDMIRVERRATQSQLDVSYYLEDLTLKTIDDEQPLIEAVLADSEVYDTELLLNEIDFSIEDNYLRYDYIRLFLLNGENMVEFTDKEDTRIYQDFNNQEMLDALVDAFPEYGFMFSLK